MNNFAFVYHAAITFEYRKFKCGVLTESQDNQGTWLCIISGQE